MSRERSGQTRHEIPWDVVERTAVEVDGVLLKLTANEGKLQLNQGELPVGRFAQAHQHGIIVKLTPGAQKYLEARTFHQRALDDAVHGTRPNSTENARNRASDVKGYFTTTTSLAE